MTHGEPKGQNEVAGGSGAKYQPLVWSPSRSARSRNLMESGHNGRQARGERAPIMARSERTTVAAYLINLDRSADRLAHMRTELDRASLPFERMPATDGTLLEADRLEAFRDSTANPDDWLPGEIGCFLSHLEVWERIAAGNAPYGIVLEDDIHVSPDLGRLFESTAWIPADADIVRLEANRPMRLSKGRAISELPGRQVFRAHSGTSGSAAYIISKRAAERLRNTPTKHYDHVDLFLFKPKVSGVAQALKRYQVVPAMCVQSGVLPGDDMRLASLIRRRNSRGRGYRERSHPLLGLWPLRRRAVPFCA